MMTRCLDRRWTATQKHIDWKTKKKKVATACVKSMQISLNEQWPLNLNTSMTIHIYRIVSWYVLTLSLHNDWIPIKTSHRQTHNEREKSAHISKVQSRTRVRTHTTHAHRENMQKLNEWTNERSQFNEEKMLAFWSNRSIIFMFPLCTWKMECIMSLSSNAQSTKQRKGKEKKWEARIYHSTLWNTEIQRNP